MEEPARLVCPRCELVYRLKKITPGRVHVCKNCGAQLKAVGEHADDAPAEYRHTAAAASGRSSVAANAGSDLSRLPGLIEKLTAHLDTLAELEDGADPDSPAAKLLDTVARLENEMGEKITALDEKLAERFLVLDEKFTAAAEKPATRPEELSALKNTLEAGQTELLGLVERRLGEQHAAQKAELSALLAPAGEAGKTTVEVDIDELADRLVAGVRGRGPVYDEETEGAVDVLARLADQLVKEQNANTTRLDKLAVEIHDAIDNISKVEEWQSVLPDRVADEIGATVEARVIGPISGALARQAPSILSDLQDSKLVDIVSRSVREAQRPLLREILAGGRNGVPVWLFASVLLPLLLILGYLFLPGEMGGAGVGAGANAGSSAEVTDALARMEATGLPLTPDAEDRLIGIEEAVLDIHNQALTHVKNAAALEEEVKNLRRLLEERDQIITDYTTTLERQTRRLQAYEFRLVQLGVKPDAVAGQ